MSRRKLDSRFGLLLVSSLVAGSAQAVGCSSNDGGIDPGNEGGAGSGGRTGGGGSTAKGGSKATSGGTNGTGAVAGNLGEGGAVTEGGGSGAIEGGAGGNSSAGAGGDSAGAGADGPVAGGAGGVGGGGASDAGGSISEKSCVYFSPGGEVVDADGVGGASPMPTIAVAKNAFAGPYLVDGAGKALYTYGADAPGDCNYVPVTNCFKDCAIAWPPFNGEPRLLGEGVEDSSFGTIERTDEVVNADSSVSQVTTQQTTYLGWPLYYYKKDAAPGDVKGQAVGKIWQLATVLLPNIVIIRIDTLRFVADEGGHALYTSEADTKGTPSKPPISACTGACLNDFEPFVLTYLSPVSYLLPSDFSYFVRGDGAPQIAYKGAPLYLSHADVRPTQTNGTAVAGWSVAAP